MWNFIFRLCCPRTLAKLGIKDSIQCLTFLLTQAQVDKEKLEGLNQAPLSHQVPQGPVISQSPASSQA